MLWNFNENIWKDRFIQHYIMSRRKQSNPKPIKRPEDESEESDVTKKMDQSDMNKIDINHSEGLSHDISRNEPMETNSVDCEIDVASPAKIKVERTDDSDFIKENETDNKPNVIISGKISPRKQEVMKRLCFPSDLLSLRQVDEVEFLQTGIPWSIITLIPVLKGSTIGPYLGESVALSSVKPGELVLQFQGGDGDFSFIKVTEETGAWLSLLRPADHTSSHNTCVYFEGGQIWCEIVEDLNKGTELLASFTTNQNELPGLIVNKVCSGSTEIASRDVKRSVQTASVKKKEPKSVSQVTTQPALIYSCPFCSVRFSSRRTLEAHLTYYCSKKPQDFVSLQQCLQQQAQAMLEKHSLLHSLPENANATPTLKEEQTSPNCLKRSSECTTSSPDNEQSDQDTPKTKSPKIDESNKCTKFNFVADGSFNGKQLPNSQNDSSVSDGERMSVSPISQEEMFCKECKIQFSSLSTYRGHKEFYCRFRPSGVEENTSESTKSAIKSVKNDLTLKILTSPTLGTEKKALLSAQGNFHAGLLALSPCLISSPQFDLQSKSQQQGEIRKAKVTSATNGSLTSPEYVSEHAADDQPLDLSKSKSSIEDDEDKRTNNKDLLVTCSISVKSEPGIQSEQLSPLAKKIKLTEKSPDVSQSVSKTTLNIPSVLPTLLLGNQFQYVNKKPIPPLQSVSRCVECNIVFYKHENYLIHKEHYCSGRQACKDSGSSDSEHVENDQKEIEQVHETNLEVVVAHNENPESFAIKQKPPDNIETVDKTKISLVVSELVFKYCCIPCKIKFSSAGTLKAHKDFYCPHGKENEIISIKDGDEKNGSDSDRSDNTIYHCDHCKNEFSSARLLKLHICIGDVSTTPLLRCLYCDYVTQSENRLSEHVKVHVPTKAFKCNLCGYRGNTARGMRMHGKMHLENGEEFTDENMIEFEEPPVVPIQRNGVCEKGPVDMETELIRLKNEPYKRRRSRKSFEKSENMVPFLGNICAACGQTFGNVSDFVIHLRMHEIAALEAMKNLKSLRCEHCSKFVADSLTALLIHMKTKHPEQFPGNSKSELDQGVSESERSISRDSQMSVNRSRSNSSDSLKTCHSDSSHDNIKDAKCEVTLTIPQDHIGHDLDNFKSYPKKSKAKEIDADNRNTELSLKDITKKSSEEKRPFEINDLELRNVKSHQYDENSSVMEDSRSNKTEKQTSLSRSPNHHMSPKSHHLSPKRERDCFPQQSSPLLHVKSEPKSYSIAIEQSQFSPVRNKSTSPEEHLRQTESKLDKFSLCLRSPDPKTRYLLSQNSSNIKLECPSPKSDSPKKSSPPSPRIPVTSPKVPLSIESQSPKLHNFPLLFSPHAILSPYQFSHGISFIPPHPIQVSPPSVVSVSEKNGRKYCKHCNINFTYLSSFLTHKKYYCSARNSNDESENPTASA